MDALDCLTVGAGMAGLMAARELAERGWNIAVVDKGRGVGGRMATRRMAGGRLDHGAQYFTARDSRFAAMVTLWRAAGVAETWCHGFDTAHQGHPRYRGRDGMTAIAKHMAEKLIVHRGTRVTRLEATGNSWTVRTDGDTCFQGAHLLLTCPVPQTLEILTASSLDLPASTLAGLREIEYDPCFALMLALSGPSQLPSPGGLEPDDPMIDWIADNQQKGISPTPLITVHATAAFARAHLEEAPEQVAETMIERVAPMLGAEILDHQLHRWKYARPTRLYPERFAALPAPHPLWLAGDAFCAPRVEGAALSAISVSEAMIRDARERAELQRSRRAVP